MKTRWKVLIGGVLLVFAIGFIVVQQIGQQTAETEIEGMDFTSVKDGQYEGSYSIAIVSATVEVTVQDGKATDIVIVDHTHGQGQDAEDIVDDVLAQQTTKVDIVSGATTSSKVILKAIEAAIPSN